MRTGGFVAAPDGTTVTLTISGTGAGSFANGSSVLTTTCTTSAGSCSVLIYSSSAGQNTVNATTTFSVSGVSLTRATGDGISSDSGPVTKTWVDAYIKLALQHTPDEINTSANTTGETVTANVFQNDGLGLGYVPAPDGTTVNLSLSGVGSFSSSSTVTSTSCITAAGTCSVTIFSSSARQTTVNASTTFSVTGVSPTRATGDGISSDSRPVLKTWVDANIALTPQHAPDEVNTSANKTGEPVTASVFQNLGLGGGFVAAPNGTTVTLTISGTGAGSFANGSSVLSTTCTITGGSCSVLIYASSAGQNTVNGTTTLLVSTVSLTPSTGEGISSDSAPVTKTWVDPYTPLTLHHTPHQVNTSANTTGETVTATVSQNQGLGSGFVAAPDGTTVNLSLSGVGSFSNSSTVTSTSCTTVAGACSVTIFSSSPGPTTVNASTTFSVSGVSMTRATGDGISLDSSGV